MQAPVPLLSWATELLGLSPQDGFFFLFLSHYFYLFIKKNTNNIKGNLVALLERRFNQKFTKQEMKC